MKLALGVEVLVDQRLRDPGASSHALEGGLVVAARGEDVERGGEDRLAPIGRGHAPSLFGCVTDVTLAPSTN